jgi:hypothetical protein
MPSIFEDRSTFGIYKDFKAHGFQRNVAQRTMVDKASPL